MGEKITLTASDGHELDAYISVPSRPSRAAIIVIQEIFGVNDHMKEVTDEFAAHGYAAICPSFFDRIESNAVLSYTDFGRGRDIVGQITDDMVVADINAAADHVRNKGKVGIIGYCWGGAMAFLGACKANVDCGISYYGTRTIQYSPNMKPKIPFQHHYGGEDKSFPMDAVKKVMAEQPEAEHFIYPGADHGFSCSERPQYNAQATSVALDRTLDFLDRIL